MSGHFWTVWGYLRGLLQPPKAPPSRAWSTTLEDPRVGSVRLSGRLSKTDGDRLLIVAHGIAGSAESAYARRAAAAALRAGLSCLRLNLRGADRSGEDLFHAGLTADLHAAIASRELAAFRHLHLVGFSLGGHVVLRLATEEHDARLRSVAAVSAPLDLSGCASSFDRPACAPYRRRILRELAGMYAKVAERRELTTSVERVARARSLREFDGLTVVPRFGFQDAEDYYRRMSVGPRLTALGLPALLIVGVSDPLVPLATLTPFLEPAPPGLTVRTLDPGGHVGFPERIDLGAPGPPGLERQLVSWLISAP